MSTAAVPFVRRALWRPAEGTLTPEPLHALLGPRGAGKTKALDAIADACAGTLVHAKLDFAEPQLGNPVVAVAYAAFMFARHWDNLPEDPAFHRVGLSLLALSEPLPPDRKGARARLLKSIDNYLHEDADDRVANLAGAAADIAAVLARLVTKLSVDVDGRKLVTGAVVALLKLAKRRRRSVRRALKWFDGLLDGANTLDSLIELSRGRTDPLDHLMRAFLADLADNAQQWSIPVRRCECEPRRLRDQPHEHAWVLLADHTDAGGGAGSEFLSALVRVRLERQPARDPLLVVAATSRWSSAWGNWWREPWRTGAESPARRPIPLLSEADFDEWTRHLDATADAAGNPTRAWFPVWLDPPTATEIAELASARPDGWDQAAFDALVRRLSGELPAAVRDITEGVRAQPSDAEPDARSLLFRLVVRKASGEHALETKPLWEHALRFCLPDTLQTKPLWHTIPQAVAVAVRLRQPGRPADDLDPAVFPDARHILRTLRESLWVSTFAARPSRLWPVAGGDEEHPAVLHPWLVACLLAGLHAESATAGRHPGALAWAELFSRMSDCYGAPNGDQDKTAVARRLYHDLACDRFEQVVAALVGRFPLDDHRDWVRLLDQVTMAPSRWPAVEPTDEVFDRLVPENQQTRDTVETSVAGLVAMLWLYHDPHTVPNTLRDKQIHTSFGRLANNHSSRLDTDALTDAAKRFGRQ